MGAWPAPGFSARHEGSWLKEPSSSRGSSAEGSRGAQPLLGALIEESWLALDCSAPHEGIGLTGSSRPQDAQLVTGSWTEGPQPLMGALS